MPFKILCYSKEKDILTCPFEVIVYPADKAMHDCDEEEDVETHTVTLEPPISSVKLVSFVALVMTSPVSEVIV